MSDTEDLDSPISHRTRQRSKALTEDPEELTAHDLDLENPDQTLFRTPDQTPHKLSVGNTDTLRVPRRNGIATPEITPRRLFTPGLRYPSLSKYWHEMGSTGNIGNTADTSSSLAEFVLKTKQRPTTTVLFDDAAAETVDSEWQIATVEQLKAWVATDAASVLKMLNNLRVERDQGVLFAEEASRTDTDNAEIRKLRLAIAELHQNNGNLADQNETVAARLEELENENDTLRRIRESSHHAEGRERRAKLTPKMREMPLFKGRYSSDEKEENKIKYEDWEMAVKDRLRENWDHYPTDMAKVVFMCNTLGGEALEHSRPRRQDNAKKAYLTPGDVFNHLAGIYGEKDREGKARREYRAARQRDNDNFAAYLSNMLRLADILDYQDEQVRDDIVDSMAPRLRDALMLNPHLRHRAPAQEMYDWLQTLDNDQLAEAERKKAAIVRKQAATSTATTTKTTKETTTSNPRRDTNTTREMERRLGLCHYCHQPGHMAATCPQKKADADKQSKN